MKAMLQLRKPKPGDAVVRFGDWRKREPQVTMDRRQWASISAPDEVLVVLDFGYQPEAEPPCGAD